MNRLVTRGLVAAAMACVAVAPNAAYANHIMTLCDNIDPGLRLFTTSIPVGNALVTVDIQLDQDSYIKVDQPGTQFDALIGIDLGTIALLDAVVVCVRAPLVGNYDVTVDPSAGTVSICFWEGEPAHTGTRHCLL